MSGSSRCRMRSGTVCAAAAIAVALAGAGRAHGAPTFVVNSTADVAKAAGASAVCETAPGNGVCTLRAAVMAANRVPGGGAAIQLPAGIYYLTSTGPARANEADGDLDLLQPATITGDGPSASIIDGVDATPILWIDLAASAGVTHVEGVTIRNGNAGGGQGGGIATAAPLVLENAVVAGSSALHGGGVFTTNTETTLSHCIVRNNHATVDGGGILASQGSVSITDSAIENNDAGYGGGVFVAGASSQFAIDRASVLLNTATTRGGGVYQQSGQLAVVNTTFYVNSSDDYGGGIAVDAGSTTLASDTFVGNVANSEHAHQPFISQGGPFGGGVGIADIAEADLVSMRNTVLVDDVSGDFQASTYRDDETGLYDIFSLDYDFCATRFACFLNGITTHVNAADDDPELRGLSANGGFSLDELPAPGSPLVGAVPAENCVDALGGPLTVDGRGMERVGACDIGAVQTSDDAYAPSPVLGGELIRNGGALHGELGEAAVDGSTTPSPPYWKPQAGGLTQVVYGSPGGFPLRGDAPAGSGAYLFTGGLAPSSTDFQVIDLSSIAGAIDAGTVGFRVSGAFGGVGAEDDSASLSLVFAPVPTPAVTLGGVTAADRGGVTKLVRQSRQGIVPPGTRTVTVSLSALRATGPYNDGYADDVSLVLPEPGGVAAAAVALAALATARRARPTPPPSRSCSPPSRSVRAGPIG